MNKLTGDIASQAKRRQQFHRRRTFDADAPIDYINEKNRYVNSDAVIKMVIWLQTMENLFVFVFVTVLFINESICNIFCFRKFNEKLERYYGEYTADLKVSALRIFTIQISIFSKTWREERLFEFYILFVRFDHFIILNK